MWMEAASVNTYVYAIFLSMKTKLSNLCILLLDQIIGKVHAHWARDPLSYGVENMERCVKQYFVHKYVH